MLQGINTTLDGIRSSLRTSLIKFAARKSTPVETFRDLRDQWQHDPIFQVWFKTYKIEKPYLDIVDSTLDFEAWVKIVKSIQQQLSCYIKTDLFADQCEEVADILLRNITSIDDCSTTVRSLKASMDEYAKIVVTDYMNLIAQNTRSDADQNNPSAPQPANFDLGAYLLAHQGGHNGEYFHLSNVTYSMFVRHAEYHTGGQYHDTKTGRVSRAIYALGSALSSTGLDHSARRFVFNQGPGSCGLYNDEKLDYLYLVPFLYSTSIQDLVTKMKTKLSDAFEDDGVEGDVEDRYQATLERRFAQQFERNGTDSIRDTNHFRDISFNSMATGFSTPTSNPTPAPASRGGRGGRTTRPTRRSARTGQPPTAPQPTVPDDDTYEPDSMLASRASDMTQEYQTTTPTDMDHDHMTRFATTSEASVSISRSQVRQTDWTFITRTRYGTTRYLVTFTRKSKKPIFSIVS